MKTLDAPTLAEQGASVSRPALLLEIGFSTAYRVCSFGDVSWSGQIWLAGSLTAADISSTGGLATAATLKLGNTDNLVGALLFNQGIADRDVTLWEAWLDTTGTPHVMPRFAGVGSSFQIGACECSIAAVLVGSARAHAPREMITPALGFTHLRPPGFKLNWNGTDYTLERN